MNSKLSVTQTLELLDNLKGTLREFADRGESLEKDFRARTTRERAQRETALKALMERQEAERIALEESFLRAKSAATAKFERRKAWITKARHASKEQSGQRIENRVGQGRYEMQKKTLQAERDREAGLQQTKQTFEEFRANLAAAQEYFSLLQADAYAAFGAYGKLRRLLAGAVENAQPDLAPDENALLGKIQQLLDRAQADSKRFKRQPLPLLFRFLPVWLLVPLCATPWALQQFGVVTALTRQTAIGLSAGAAVAVVALYFIGMQLARSLAGRIAGTLGDVRVLHDACLEKAETRFKEDTQAIQTTFRNQLQTFDHDLKQVTSEAVNKKGSLRQKIDDQTLRVTAKNEQVHQRAIEEIERRHTEDLKQWTTRAEAEKRGVIAEGEEKEARINAALQAEWQTIEAQWNARVQPVYQTAEEANAAADKLAPPWQPQFWANWTPPLKFADAAKFGRLEVDAATLGGALPRDRRLALPGPAQFTLPLLLTYPGGGSIVFETTNTGREEAVGALNNIVLRLLSNTPPGRLNFTIFDPVGLGQNFAGVMHLADYEERLINSRIWTQSGQFEEKLAELNEHMEKVIQMYLRNEYATIAEYNEQAGDIAEKYHFLVVADFPANFTESAVKRLLSIAASGARCGVFTLIHWDRRQPLPHEFAADDLVKSGVHLVSSGREFLLLGKPLPGAKLWLETPPSPDFATEFIQKVGKSSRDSSRVEVPFSHVAPPEAEIWSEDTTNELRVPIGRTGATKLQYLAIGKGTRQHALVAGKTGSGKSTLFHVIVTNLALWCSPEQVEFYLIDFKKGVEFKTYAAKRLPHARVVAIESDREFGLSVLQRVDEELRRRGDLFRKFGAQDIAGYKRAGGTEPVPRTLLLIDEFQEFFVEDDKVSQGASLLLDRIVRQGRAFGIHVILGSQTLGGAYTLARTTLGQMVIRIALQCNEADAYLIMDDTNPAPRLLSRPGEGIYNDSAGSLEGNSPFQTVWLPDEVRDTYLDKVSERARQSGKTFPGPIVFEGNAPADVRENASLRHWLAAETVQPPAVPRIWLGAPNSIKGPTEAVFQRQSGNNMLIVGQREEAAMGMVALGLVSLAAQYPAGSARLILLDGNPPGTPQSEFMERIVRAIPHPVTVARGGGVEEIMNGLAEELKQRSADATGAAPVFLFIHGLQKYKKLRYEEDFSFSSGDADGAANPAMQLNNVILEGGSLGLHVIATCDTYNNATRFLSRKALGEFEMRVLFQMSATDSASLIDSPKANTLGLHRAIYYNEQEGYLEVFRPYALPDAAWIEEVERDLARFASRS